MSSKNDIDSLLDEAFLQKLDMLRIMAQKRVRGLNIGEHASWRGGGNLEFLDHRNYQLGDDLRYVDWNVYGRLDKLFIKLFQAERDLSIYVVLDMSLSMSVGSPSKELYAKKIAAALSYIGLGNMDRVGLASFNNSLSVARAPEKGRQVYLTILEFLLGLTPDGETDLNSSLIEFAASAKQKGIVIVISDLLDQKGFQKGIKTLIQDKYEIIVVQVLDQQERFPKLNGYLKLKDLETAVEKNLTLNPELVARYQQKFETYISEIKNFCLENGIEYFLADTHLPFEDFLLDFLNHGKFVY
jgi:uncharacterized protein (DUF58 family)